MSLRHTGGGKVGVYPNVGVATHGLLYNFDIDGHSLKKEHKSFLDAHVIPLLATGGHSVLRGHCSRSGTSRYNDGLSERRAQEVLRYLGQRAPASHVFMSKGMGESLASAAGQKDELEDEYYRAVSLVVSPKPIPEMKVPKKKDKPTPYPPKAGPWRKESISLRADVIDLMVVKKMSGHLYLTQGFCKYLAWPFSVSALSATVDAEGKPPIWFGDMKAAGASLWYNDKIFDPGVAWDDKTVSIRMVGKNVRIVIRNGLPAAISSDYIPVKHQGITIVGRNVIFELTQDGGEMGLVEGVGSIGTSTSRAGLCA